MTRKAVTRRSVAVPQKPSERGCLPMSETGAQVPRFLDELRRQNASPHTIKSYGGDLLEFAAFLTPPDRPGPALAEIDLLTLREWLAHLHESGAKAVTMRRKVAALRMFFRFLMREGTVPANPARLLRLPKLPQYLPSVPTAELTNALLNDVSEGKLERPYPQRDLAILELLYGCGLRVSELVGLDLEHVDMNEHWLLVRGKGRKERQVPVAARGVDGIRELLTRTLRTPGRTRYLSEPSWFPAQRPRRPADREGVFDSLSRRSFLASPQFPARLRHALTGGWCGLAVNSGIARPRPPIYYPEIHSSILDGLDEGLRFRAPQSLGCRLAVLFEKVGNRHNSLVVIVHAVLLIR